MNQIGYVDLGSKKVSVKEIPEELLQQYLGGRGLNAYLLYNHVKKGTDPLSPENALIFGAGLLSGHFANAYSRFHVTGKSPETGIYGDSNMGGSIAAELKYAGFQHLVIKGKADKPTYLWVHDGEIEFRDASHLWGVDTYETQLKISEELNEPEAKIACIGQAGEKLVRFANVRHLMKRSAGRMGMGCIMGSKRLKAIAVKGSQGLIAKSPEKLLELTKKQYDYARRTKIFQIVSRWCNLFVWPVWHERESISVRNHQASYFPESYGKIDVDIFLDNYSEKMLACHSCPMHCQHRFHIKSGPFAGLKGEGPEWILWNLYCSHIGNTRLDVALAALDLANKYGIDYMTYGLYLAWLMELWQRGIINEKDTGGLNLEWGNPEAIIQIIHQVANREGLGNVISDGSEEAIKRIGRGCERYLYRCGKGLTLEPSNWRILRATPLGNMTSNRGNDHLRGIVNLEFMNLPAEVMEKIFWRPVDPNPHTWETKAWMATWSQYLYTISDATGLCRFWTKFMAPDFWGFEEPCEVINAVTGWGISREELMEIGERIWNIERLFNVREGLGRKSDMPPPLLFEPIKEGARKGLRLEPEKWERLLDEYYELHGWDKEGRPSQQTLQRLNLDKEPSHIL